MPTAGARGKAARLTRMEAGLRGQAGAEPGRRCAARRPAGAWPRRPACARPAGRLPPRRHQAALRRLGRADGLLPLFGDAGRPLRARRAWRAADALAGQRRALRRAAGDQPSAGLRQGLPRPRPGLHPARRAGSRRDGRRGSGGNAGLAGAARGDRRLARRTQTLLDAVAALRRQTSPTAGWRWKSASSRPWPRASRPASRAAIRLSERVHHRPVEAIGLALRGGLGVAAGWLGRIGRHKQPWLGDRQAMTTEPQAASDPAALQAQVSGSSFYAAMRVMPKARARGHVRDLHASAAWSTTSPTTARGRARRGPRSSTGGAPISTRSTPAGRPGRPASCRTPVRASACGRRISSP